MVKNNRKAIILLSGGLDSTTVLFWALNNGYSLEALYIDFEHSAKDKELKCVTTLCDMLRIKLHILINPLSPRALEKIGFLYPSSKIADPSFLNILTFKNLVFILSLGIEFAYKIGINIIFMGLTANNAKDFPGINKRFFEIYQDLAQNWFDTKFTINNPFIEIPKSEVVKIGQRLNVPYELTWSCTNNYENHCGVCARCIERKNAFIKANLKDPTVYQDGSDST